MPSPISHNLPSSKIHQNFSSSPPTLSPLHQLLLHNRFHLRRCRSQKGLQRFVSTWFSMLFRFLVEIGICLVVGNLSEVLKHNGRDIWLGFLHDLNSSIPFFLFSSLLQADFKRNGEEALLVATTAASKFKVGAFSSH